MLALLVLAGTVMITPGYSISHNFGEGHSLHPAIRAGYVSDRVEVFGQWDSADKTESGRGFILGGDLLLRHKGLVGGASYRYRDGGNWVKQSVWGRAGVERGALRLLYGHDFNSANRVRMVTLGVRVSVGRITVEPQLSLASYVQSGERRTGTLTGLWIGRAW